MNEIAILVFSKVTRFYPEGGGKKLVVLDKIDCQINEGEMVALVGPSGAGKSTLLHTAGLLERPDSGHVHLGGKETTKLSDFERARFRRQTLGFVYQFHHLLPEFSALENVMVPLILNQTPKKQARDQAHDWLKRVGLSRRATHRPAQLSGGEQQRVAIARALVHGPKLLLADEPTGNLDHKTALEVFDQLKSLIAETGLSALVATHNLELASQMNRGLRLEDQKISAL